MAQAFRPDHVNYAFLQNQDRHVHLHVVPRYATRRDVAGEGFVDRAYPDHYTVGSPARTLRPMVFAGIADTLRDAIRVRFRVIRADDDLWTAVMHELGHVLGDDDLPVADQPHDLMAENMPIGVLRPGDA